MTEAAGQGMKNPVSTLAWLQALRGLAALAVVLVLAFILALATRKSRAT